MNEVKHEYHPEVIAEGARLMREARNLATDPIYGNPTHEGLVGVIAGLTRAAVIAATNERYDIRKHEPLRRDVYVQMRKQMMKEDE